MLSTTHTLRCPACGQQATIKLITVRHERTTRRVGFEPLLTFSCRSRCTLDLEVVRGLCGVDVAVG